MEARIALLRGVNVGSVKLLMADLKRLAEAEGLANPRTLLQSGNLVFESDREPVELERVLEAAIAGHMGRAIDVLVRTADEWTATLEANPFVEEARADPAHTLVTALKREPTPEAIAALEAMFTGPERAAVVGRAMYLVYPVDVGNSKLAGPVLERKLGVRGTARNWNTAQKLRALCTE